MLLYRRLQYVCCFAVKDLEVRMMKKPRMNIQIAECPIIDKIVINNLRQNICDEEITLYFEDVRNCPDGGDVVDVKMFNNNTSAVVQFLHSSGACYFNCLSVTTHNYSLTTLSVFKLLETCIVYMHS